MDAQIVFWPPGDTIVVLIPLFEVEYEIELTPKSKAYYNYVKWDPKFVLEMMNFGLRVEEGRLRFLKLEF